jgi:hypothetical protein
MEVVMLTSVRDGVATRAWTTVRVRFRLDA